MEAKTVLPPTSSPLKMIFQALPPCRIRTTVMSFSGIAAAHRSHSSPISDISSDTTESLSSTIWSFSPVGVITHPGLGRLELTSMLVCSDSWVGLTPELTVSNPVVVVFPGEVLTHRTIFPTSGYLQPRHSGLSPHGSTTAI